MPSFVNHMSFMLRLLIGRKRKHFGRDLLRRDATPQLTFAMPP